MGNFGGGLKGTACMRALRMKSRFEYSPLMGISVSGAWPVTLKIGPSSIGRHFMARPMRFSDCSASSAAMYPYGDENSNQNSIAALLMPRLANPGAGFRPAGVLPAEAVPAAASRPG